MAEAQFGRKAMNAARHLKAWKDILAGFLKGGWAAAGAQAIKHYWPVILSAALFILLLPLLILLSLPMIFFGFPGSQDADIITLNNRANEVNAFFDTYEDDYDGAIDAIKKAVEDLLNAGYIFSQEGEKLSKKWFVAIFMVSIENDLHKASKGKVLKVIAECMTYEVISSTVQGVPSRIILKLFTPEQVMSRLGFSEEQTNWAQLMHDTLEHEEDSNG